MCMYISVTTAVEAEGNGGKQAWMYMGDDGTCIGWKSNGENTCLSFSGTCYLITVIIPSTVSFIET